MTSPFATSCLTLKLCIGRPGQPGSPPCHALLQIVPGPWCLVHVCSREQQYGHTLGWCCLSCFTGGGLGAAGATTIATSLDGYSYLTHLDVAGTLLEQMGLHIRIVSCVLFLVSTTVRWGKRFSLRMRGQATPLAWPVPWPLYTFTPSRPFWCTWTSVVSPLLHHAWLQVMQRPLVASCRACREVRTTRLCWCCLYRLPSLPAPQGSGCCQRMWSLCRRR